MKTREGGRTCPLTPLHYRQDNLDPYPGCIVFPFFPSCPTHVRSLIRSFYRPRPFVILIYFRPTLLSTHTHTPLLSFSLSFLLFICEVYPFLLFTFLPHSLLSLSLLPAHPGILIHSPLTNIHNHSFSLTQTRLTLETHRLSQQWKPILLLFLFLTQLPQLLLSQGSDPSSPHSQPNIKLPSPSPSESSASSSFSSPPPTSAHSLPASRSYLLTTTTLIASRRPLTSPSTPSSSSPSSTPSSDEPNGPESLVSQQASSSPPGVSPSTSATSKTSRTRAVVPMD